MIYKTTRTAGRRTRSTILAAVLVILIATLIGVLGYPSLVVWPSSAPSRQPAASHSGDRTSVTNLDPDLRQALRRATTDAAADGITIYVTSGWRSRKTQEQLFREAVAKYGSKAEAARWVAIPGTSAHESGNAVDLAAYDATAWLARHGAAYGLCQIYDNEVWHYERRPTAVDHGCPPRYADPTQDPRMR